MAERLESGCDFAFLTKIGNPDRIECGKVAGCIDIGRSLGDKVAQASHCELLRGSSGGCEARHKPAKKRSVYANT